MKDIYFIVKDLLSQVDGLYVDFDYGQLDEPQPPVKFPCALLTISYPQCDDLTGSDQRVRCLIGVKMGFMVSAQNTANIYTDQKIDISLSFFDTVNQVHGLMQHFSNYEIEPLSRKSAVTTQRKGLVILASAYDTYFDESA
jgi:hypothetical protein